MYKLPHNVSSIPSSGGGYLGETASSNDSSSYLSISVGLLGRVDGAIICFDLSIITLGISLLKAFANKLLDTLSFNLSCFLKLSE